MPAAESDDTGGLAMTPGAAALSDGFGANAFGDDLVGTATDGQCANCGGAIVFCGESA